MERKRIREKMGQTKKQRTQKIDTYKNRKQNNHADRILEHRTKPQSTLTALSVDIKY